MTILKLHGEILNQEKINKMFKDRSLHIKIWRYRWFLRVPYDTLIIYYITDKDKRSFKRAYQIAVSEALYRIKWHYVLQETINYIEREELNEK